MTRLLALAGVVAISFSAVWVRLAEVSPGTAAFYRAVYALPVLGLLWLAGRRRDARGVRQRWMAVGAGALLGADFVFWHNAIEQIGAGLATVLGNTQVLFVGAAAWLLHRERPTRLARATVPLVFAGVVLISGLGRADAYGANPAAGVVLGVLTALTYAGFLLILRAANRVQAPPAGPLLDATLGAAAVCLAFGAFEPGFSLAPTWPAHGWLVALALGSQAGGWLLISWALPRLAALETSVMLLVQPMATVLWAWILFAEDLSAFQWAGVALVLSGVGLLSAVGSVEKGPVENEQVEKNAFEAFPPEPEPEALTPC